MGTDDRSSGEGAREPVTRNHLDGADISHDCIGAECVAIVEEGALEVPNRDGEDHEGRRGVAELDPIADTLQLAGEVCAESTGSNDPDVSFTGGRHGTTRFAVVADHRISGSCVRRQLDSAYGAQVS